MPDDKKIPPPVPTTFDAVLSSLNYFARDLKVRFDEDPSGPLYPLGIALIASTPDDSKSFLSYFRTVAHKTDDGKADGHLQALAMSRDLLMLCLRLNDQFKLGLDLGLAAVMSQHPLLVAKYGAQQPVIEQNADGTRTVRDFIEDSDNKIKGGSNVH